MTSSLIDSLENSYAKLPKNFYETASPDSVPDPQLICFNDALAADLGFNPSETSEKELAAVFSGNQLLNHSLPIATAYAGHQFGHFVPQLGDGRAHLLGETKDKKGNRFDIQLKGSGQTPFSRGGDGKSSLGPVLREYIVSEAMYRLDIPTSRALAAVTTGEEVYRDEVLPGAIFTRVASSHLRVGTFEYFACRSDKAALETLLQYSCERHYPHLLDKPDLPLAFLSIVCEKIAILVAKWMSVGFIHGVMNTDNTSIAGITIDYGPCAFMDEFKFAKVFSSIDRHGRYAYINQPAIAHWNLNRLADSLKLLANNAETWDKRSKKVLETFPAQFQEHFQMLMLGKFGIQNCQQKEKGGQLISAFLQYLEANELDFTLSFRHLSRWVEDENLEEYFPASRERNSIYKEWMELLADEKSENLASYLNTQNPLVIPRNHQIEKAITEGIEGNLDHFYRLHQALQDPFADNEEYFDLAAAPRENERVRATFCGT